MVRSGFMPAIVRRPLVAIGLASALASTGVGTESGGLRQDPAPAAQQQQADPLKFSHDGALLLVWQIKPDRAEGFEQAWMTIRQALAKHQNADIRAFGESWSIHKVEAISPQSVIYIFHLNPVSKTYSYNPSPLLFETLKAPTPDPGAATPPANPPGTFSYDEAKAIFDKINGAWIEAGGIVPWPLRKLS